MPWPPPMQADPMPYFCPVLRSLWTLCGDIISQEARGETRDNTRDKTRDNTRDKTRDKTRDTTRDKAAAYMWAEILAPDAASGCPSATAPPHVLNFSVGKSSAFWQDSAWAANASLISICNRGNTY